MLNAIGKGGSIRTWIATGMAIALLPLAVTALGGYLVLGRGVIASFQDVAAQQRDEIDPTQRLRLLLLEAATPLDDYVDEGNPRLPAAYCEQRQLIETAFASVHDKMRRDPELRVVVERARDDWTAADRLAAEARSVRRPPGDPHSEQLMDGFHGPIVTGDTRIAATVSIGVSEASQGMQREELIRAADAALYRAKAAGRNRIAMAADGGSESVPL